MTCVFDVQQNDNIKRKSPMKIKSDHKHYHLIQHLKVTGFFSYQKIIFYFFFIVDKSGTVNKNMPVFPFHRYLHSPSLHHPKDHISNVPKKKCFKY